MIIPDDILIYIINFSFFFKYTLAALIFCMNAGQAFGFFGEV